MIRFMTLLFAVAVANQASGDFSYPDFSSTNGLTLNQNATQVGNQLQLSSATFTSYGSAFTTAPTSLGAMDTFSTHFQFQITNSGGIGDGDGPGGDGLVFVVQAMGNNVVGGAGGGIGYLGIGKSLGIQFDTYQNAGDPSGNYVGVDVNGSTSSIATANEPTRFNNGQIWNAWINYNGNTDTVNVSWSLTNIQPNTTQLSTTVNLQQILGSNSAYVGFTSAGAYGWGDHNILNWGFQQSLAAVPEPSSLLMLGLGMVGAFGYRRLRGR